MPHVPGRRRLLGLIPLLLTAAACSSSVDCNRVAPRLLDDCRLTFGRLGSCSQARAASVASDGAEQIHDLTIRLCEAADPAGDEACYLTAKCEDIERDACVPPAEQPPTAECRARCEEAVLECLAGCDSQVALAVCEDCVIGCNGAFSACRRGC